MPLIKGCLRWSQFFDRNIEALVLNIPLGFGFEKQNCLGILFNRLLQVAELPEIQNHYKETNNSYDKDTKLILRTRTVNSSNYYDKDVIIIQKE